MDHIIDLSQETKKFSWIFLAAGIISIIFGLFLIIKPIAGTEVIMILIGLAFILSGILHIVAYSKADFLPGIGWIMLQGILDIVMGIIIIIYWKAVGSFIPFFIGLWMIINGTMRIPASFTMKKFGSESWWSILLMAVLMIICGFLFFSNPKIGGIAFLTALGVYLILGGVSALVEYLNLRKLSGKIKQFTNDVIEIEQ